MITTQKTVYFMVGAGGSGKGYVISNSPELRNLPTVNSDNFIEAHPGFISGELQPSDLHAWAEGQMEAQWDLALTGNNSFILDGTGKTAANVQRRMEAARAAGFQIVAIWVKVPVGICLQRNQQRVRQVPENFIIDAWNKVAANWELYVDWADQAQIIHNI